MTWAARYPVELEVEGPTAMFARPDTGSTPVSCPVPTFSAAKGMFESVARTRHAQILPTHVEICRPLRYERFATNYGGPLRKSGQLNDRTSYQLIATVLVDVCYRIHGIVVGVAQPGSVNEAHRLQEMFKRRLTAGQTWYTPCLGWKEFIPSYFGPLRQDTTACADLSFTVPAFLRSVFAADGTLRPRFVTNAEIKSGILQYGEADPGDE